MTKIWIWAPWLIFGIRGQTLGGYGFDGTWSPWELCQEYSGEELVAVFPSSDPNQSQTWVRKRVCQFLGDPKLTSSNDTICSTVMGDNPSRPIAFDQDGQYYQHEKCQVTYEPWPSHCFNHCSKSCDMGICEIRRKCLLNDEIFRTVEDELCSHLGPTLKDSRCNYLPCDDVCPWQERSFDVNGLSSCHCGCSETCPNPPSDPACTYCARWHNVNWQEEVKFEIHMVTDPLPRKWLGIGFSNGLKMTSGINAVIGYVFDDKSSNHNQIKRVYFDGYNGPREIPDVPRRGGVSYENGTLTLRFTLEKQEFNLPNSTTTNFIYPYSGGLVDPLAERDPIDSRHLEFAILGHLQRPVVVADEPFEECAMVVDPINGMWAPWSSWSACSTTCGRGRQMRLRACENPVPRWGGLRCKGESRQETDCHLARCAECMSDLNAMYWYPPTCLGHEDHQSIVGCLYVASWQWRADSNYVEFVVKSSDLSKWTGIGFSLGNPMTGQGGGLHLVIGFKSLYEQDKRRLGKFWIPAGFQALSKLQAEDSYMFPNLVELPDSDLKWEQRGFRVDEVVEDGQIWLEMRFHQDVAQYGLEPWNLNLTAPLNFLFPYAGGDKGALSRSGFDVLIEPKLADVVEEVNLAECQSEVKGQSDISCYHCENEACSPQDPDSPGHAEKCPSGVVTCIKFHGYIGPFLHHFRACGPMNSSHWVGHELQGGCHRGPFQLSGSKPAEGEICACSTPLCNAGNHINAWVSTNMLSGVFSMGVGHWALFHFANR